jgi:arylsulfatase A-like enzyme
MRVAHADRGFHMTRVRLPPAVLVVAAFALSGCSQQETPSHVSSTAVPQTAAPDAPFTGTLGDTIRDSSPAYLPRSRVAAGTPNVVIVLADDLGYADIAPYGSEIATPNLQALADSGLRYSHFTVNGVCSPTRASLLTGLNHHAAGVGWLSEWDTGYPGYRGEIHPDVATVPEILRDRGFATLMVGKWHLTLASHRSPVGPFDSWPTQRGFDRYWGFLDGESSQWFPHALIDGTAQVPKPDDPEFYLPDALTEHAIGMIRDLRALDPQRPFFLYYASGAPHAPHHTRARDRAKYLHRYDAGYDAIRAERLAAQKALGIVPANTTLAPRNPGVQAWDALAPDQQRMYARLQENYAAYVDNLDQNIGRLREYLAATGELDNTIFIFLSDNGASREVGVEGATNALAFFHNHPQTTAENLRDYDRVGEADTHPHYPHGWMQASNTPFAHGKRTSWEGGVHVPFIISWPAGVPARGEIRSQFHHVNDVAPTLLELLGMPQPDMVGGRRVKPMQGVSMAYSLRDASAPGRKPGQYFEVEAQRAYVAGDWKIVGYRDEKQRYDAQPWRLFNLAEDFAETRDLSATHPDKVRELDTLWWQAARENDVLPLVDLPLLERAFRTRPDPQDGRRDFRIERGVTPIPVGSAPVLAGKSYTITAELHGRKAGDQGVLIADGDTHSGYTLYVQDDRLIYELNVGFERKRLVSTEPLPAGDVTVAFRFAKVSTPLALASGLLRQGEIDPWTTLAGTGTLLVNGKEAGSVAIDTPLTAVWEGLEVGRDGLTPVSPYYASPFEYSGEMAAVSIHID